MSLGQKMEEPVDSSTIPQHGHSGQHVIRCGWLRKQGGFVKTWHTRWFVLKGEQLYYYKDEDETKALGTIALHGNRVTEHPNNGDEAGKFLFEVVPGGDRERMTANHETYLLMASTQNDMEDWVKTIRRVIWAPFGGGIFGQKLEETMRYEKHNGNKQAPMLVEKCVDFIRQRGLQEEGLFRLPGQANLVKELQDAFDCGEKPFFDGSSTDVHTVASLLKLYLRELPEPVIPFAKYEEFLACATLLGREEESGMKELRNQVEILPQVNYNLLKYICRFLDEVQSYSDVNKMSVQNLATVFGPNILRPKIEDPLTIMEGTVLVQQLMSVLIGRHDVLFPKEEEHQTDLQMCNNNSESEQTQATGHLQNEENNNNVAAVRQCSWEMPESQQKTTAENGSPTPLGGPQSGSPPHSLTGKLDVTRSPPFAVKKNPAYSKGSGIVTNGSFSSNTADGHQEKSEMLSGGGIPARRTSSLKGCGTKMGTSGVSNGSIRLGVSSTDAVNGTLNGRSGLWVANGYVTMRDSKTKDCLSEKTAQQHRLSTYDNVQQQNSSNNSCEDKQSVDSATWSTSSCEISLPDNSNSCWSSSTTCPEQDFFVTPYDEPVLYDPSHDELGQLGEFESKASRRDAGGRSSLVTSSSDNSDTRAVNNGPGSHAALHSLVGSLKQEMLKQKTEYDAKIKSLEQHNLQLEAEMVNLHEELDQERKKYTMVEIKLRNAERAKEDAEKRNEMLQKEMEQFFSTFGELTADPRRPERANTVWIQ
ncbi:rho GTPase-activating protein 24 isoform X1 [Paramormyrops kingsleyae]|uniref:Rho GTPase-activating protein 24 n=2 Tax=Paramormyrops kingsleyae TaxID=1676925 RepID=A0A3B3RZ56_9TELE|nr:rho GTPase-activating protein 24 isoform X1 [Paramormyrops kingsleyae]XP_023684429.1 rho GTPase-activating protein 24 isoform X1 [Paramormyrops kingsleyae]